MKKNSSKNYHTPKTVEQLTDQNVQTIASLEAASKEEASRSDIVAEWITQFCGSVVFLWVHIIWFAIWILLNTVIIKKAFDPFPFSFLTLTVSLEAIFLSAFILIAENRQTRLAERRSHLDLQINLLTEQENTKVLQLLHQIAEKVGIAPERDPTISVLEKATRPEKLLEQIDAVQENEKPQKPKRRRTIAPTPKAAQPVDP